MHNKAQVTIFIIVGIVILLGVALFLYVRSSSLSIPSADEVPAEFLPVREFIDGCIRLTAEQGIGLLGMQGGYITLPPDLENNPYAHVELSPGGLKLPYWYVDGRNRMPTRDEMARQLAAYVDENLKYCLGELAPLKASYDLTISGAPTSTAAIGDKDVTVLTSFPVEATLKGVGQGEERRATVSSYGSALPVSLGRMHELAGELLDHENKYTYLENLTVNLMAIGPDIPFTGIELYCGKKKWYTPHVKQDIRDLLFYNLPRVAIERTGHQPIPDEDALGQHMFTWEATGKDFRDITAGVVVQPDWRFDLYVRPSSGDIMPASYGKGASEFLPFLCINAYHFTYDVIYPVQVVLRDDDAFNGRGFLFMYAMPVLVNHNKGDRTAFPISVFDSPLDAGEACENIEGRPVTIRALSTFGDYVEGANVTFDCASAVECPLGSTKFMAGIYSLTTPLPDFCQPGMLRVEHQDYVPAMIGIDRSAAAMDVHLTPLKKLDLLVQKKQLRGSELIGPYPLDASEYAIIFMSTKDVPNFAEYRSYPNDITIGSAFGGELTLPLVVQDNVQYDLEVLLMDEDDKLIGGYRGNWIPRVENFIDGEGITLTVIEVTPHPGTGIDEQAKAYNAIQNPAYLNTIPPLFEDAEIIEGIT